jgi:MarR family transcriptional regulator, transcriptional regulator for hemolysin
MERMCKDARSVRHLFRRRHSSPHLTRELGKISPLVRARDLAPHGLHPGQDVVVWLLGRHPDGLTVRQIAEQLSLDGPSVTRSLTRLDDQGWFTLRPVPGDRRQVLVVPSRRAVELVDPIEDSWAVVARTACAGMTENDQKSFLAALDCVMTNLRTRAQPGQ